MPPHPSSGSSLRALASSSGKSSIFWIAPCQARNGLSRLDSEPVARLREDAELYLETRLVVLVRLSAVVLEGPFVFCDLLVPFVAFFDAGGRV